MKCYKEQITFPLNLRDARINAGYTQAALADKLGMTRQNYSRYESVELNAQPSLELLCELSCVLGTTPNDLIGYSTLSSFDELEYAHKVLNNFKEENEHIEYYCFYNKLSDFGKGKEAKLTIEIPKNKFKEMVSWVFIKAQVLADKDRNKRIVELFKEMIDKEMLSYYLDTLKE